MTDDAPVLWKSDDRGVATVTLNRPERNNAYNGDLIAGLHAAMDALGSESGLRAVVFKGNGRHFQAGADLTWLQAVRDASPDENIRVSRATAEAVHRLNHLPVPTFAAVQGACVGGGTGLLSACDVVIAAEDARFAISEVRWGLTAAIIVPQLVDAIGARNLRRYAITSEMFDATEAKRIGLIHEIVASDALDARLDEVVAKTLESASRAIAETKADILRLSHGAISTGDLDRLINDHAAKRQSDEAGEGLASFKEKRPARWSSEAS